MREDQLGIPAFPHKTASDFLVFLAAGFEHWRRNVSKAWATTRSSITTRFYHAFIHAPTISSSKVLKLITYTCFSASLSLATNIIILLLVTPWWPSYVPISIIYFVFSVILRPVEKRMLGALFIIFAARASLSLSSSLSLSPSRLSGASWRLY